MYELFPGNYRWSFNAMLSFAAGGQMGDFALIYPRLRENQGVDEAWHNEWAYLAEVQERRAQTNLSMNGRESAVENFYLASLYQTIGEHFIPPSDPRRLQSYARVLKTFEQARAHSSWPVERVLVPFEDTTLPAYFMPALTGLGPRPTVIFICGLDTTKELSFLRVRQQLAVRGMHCLAIDTPGVGEALRYQKILTRYDYEKPVGAAIDFLQSRKDVATERIGIIGSSLGGYYVTRAAAFEPRLKAVVAWGAIYDYHAVWVRRLTVGGTVAAPTFQLMYITGTDGAEAALTAIAEFRVAPIAGRIRGPFLVVHGAEDLQVSRGDAERMFDAIGSSEKELKVFSGEDAGAAHCQFEGHLPAIQYIGDWLAGKLGSR
jgi:dienelactone hydrolase